MGDEAAAGGRAVAPDAPWPQSSTDSAAVKRDAAAAESAATKPSSGSDCVENGVTATDILNKIVSNEEEYNEAGVEFDSQFDEAESQHNGSTNGTDSRSQATPSPPNAAIVIAAQTVPPAPAAVPQAEGARASNRAAVATEPVRGKKRQEQAADFEFLEKRMRHDFLMKEKECATEARRLALEEKRLAWEEERGRAELRLRERESERAAQEREQERRFLAEQREREKKEKTEEHDRFLAQQQCMLSILERVLEKINK
ncbi:inner centromere protein-like [Rhipicephalus sanguineus]|uniref:inner centromere protein-like n=1 Tax=Rhipicephalus sanguineus TaxID=34632 RepID=UPI001894D83C|nr:inner centromere protein-like [Rhipicephalus sanguineus]